MDYDSFKTDRDDIVRDGAGFEAYRRPGDLIDSQHPKITAYARRVAGEGSDREKALRLYYAVRDDLRYDPYNTPMKREAYRASTTLAAGHGYCVNKAGLMAAVCRAVGIPARVGYADVRNHMTTKRLSELMGSDIFYYHGYTEVWLDGRWVKATPAFNKELTERFGLKPLDWDGVADSIYHPFDLGGRRHMEYLGYRGVFADIPFDEIRGAFRHYYPRMTRAQEEMPLGGDLGGDFGAEGAAGSHQEVSLVPRSAGYVALLVALGSFGPLTMSIYTPVMPSVGADLGAGADSVKLTLTTYMLGFAVGQLFYGPMSDRFGRRPVLLGGLIFFTAATFGCSLRALDRRADRSAHPAGPRCRVGLGDRPRAHARRLHVPGNAAGDELDIARPEHRAVAVADDRRFSGELAGWRATFWFVGGFGTILLVVTLVGLRETNKFRSDRIDLGKLLRGSGEMLRDRQFLGNVLTLGFAFAINFGMLAGVPFILQDSLGFSPREFGADRAALGRRLHRRHPGRTIGWSAACADRHHARLGLVPRSGSVGHGHSVAVAASSPGGRSSGRTWC